MTKVDRNIRLFVFITWGAFVVYGIVNHVYWRDEVRPLSIALSSDSFLDLFANLKNEGHPILWYFLLKVSCKRTLILEISCSFNCSVKSSFSIKYS